MDEHLAAWAEHIDRIQWAACLVDSEWRMQYVSKELRGFLHAGEEDLGYGRHVLEALTLDAYLRTVTPDSLVKLFKDLGPFMLSDFVTRGRDPREVLPEHLVPLLDEVEPAEVAPVWSTSFMYVEPTSGEELPPYRVDVCFLQIRDEQGTFLGCVALFFMGVRPNLLALLARGDEEMYERMAKLVEPNPHRSAVLFCDLHRSVRLSRQLPSATYFKLVRRLWTGIDAAVAGETGIIGKHAGDGASAFFLVDELGSPSGAAAAAVRAARRIHDISGEVFDEIMDSECLMKVGLHWGGNLYMGQLVPGGRLDVTALGDEVNETARVQEAAQPGETLATKQLLEQLSADDAASLGIDLEKLSYQTLGDLPGVSEKALKDVGGISIASFKP